MDMHALRNDLGPLVGLSLPPPWFTALLVAVLALTTALASGCAGGGGDDSGAGAATGSGPQVQLIEPHDGSTDVARNASIAVRFSNSMEPASTEAALQITPVVSGTPSWSGDGRELRLQPDRLLSGFELYTITLDTTARDASGQALADPAGAAFLVEDDMPSRVDQTSPEHTSDLVAVNFTVRITFTEAMDPVSTAAALSFSPAATGTISFNADDTVLFFTPAPDFAAFTAYTVTVSTHATDPGGTPLDAPFSFVFTTDDHRL
jgi:Bacterial Ig-like domain